MGNKHEFIGLVRRHLQHKYDEQVEAIRAGIACVMPIEMLRLLSWEEMEVMVCGRAEWGVEELQKITEYKSCSKDSPHVKLFWEAMALFDQTEKNKFLKFVNGSTRVPTTQKFKLQPFQYPQSQEHLPESHTCFFALDLPEYKTLALMQEKLRQAFNNCGAIDADDTGTANAAARLTYVDEDDDDSEDGESDL
jgi:hypothetical protein